MTIGAILIGVGMLVISCIVVTRPLSNNRIEETMVADDVQPEPTDTYRETLLALRDLDFDYQTGVVIASDYQPLRAKLMAQAAQMLVQNRQMQTDMDSQIEAAVRTRRQTSQTPPTHLQCQSCHAGLSLTDKFCAACGTAVSANCPACHQPHDGTDKFCATCGTALSIAREVLA